MISTEPQNICSGDSTKSTEHTSTYTLSKILSSAYITRANPPSLTQATDTSNIRLVFAAVKETILQNALKDSGIL
jgi:uncharacterized protein YpuA (DUF1002 family)